MGVAGKNNSGNSRRVESSVHPAGGNLQVGAAAPACNLKVGSAHGALPIAKNERLACRDAQVAANGGLPGNKQFSSLNCDAAVLAPPVSDGHGLVGADGKIAALRGFNHGAGGNFGDVHRHKNRNTCGGTVGRYHFRCLDVEVHIVAFSDASAGDVFAELNIIAGLYCRIGIAFGYEDAAAAASASSVSYYTFCREGRCCQAKENNAHQPRDND